MACLFGDLSTVDDCLTRLNLDPSFDNNITIRNASYNGHDQVVQRLLQHPNIDPSANENEAINTAAMNGYLLVVDLLLQDARVLPSNTTLRLACENGRSDVVNRLLQNSRIDPSSNCYTIVHSASYSMSCKTIDRLMQDVRVNPMSLFMPIFGKIQMIQTRAAEICIGLQDLSLPALVTLEILDALFPTNTVTMYKKWTLITLVKHFKQQKNQL